LEDALQKISEMLGDDHVQNNLHRLGAVGLHNINTAIAKANAALNREGEK